MRQLLALLSAYIRRFFLQWLAGRGFIFTLVIEHGVTPLIGLAVWSTALPNQPEIQTYYVALLVAELATVSYENHTFANRIYEGRLADDLLRPHSIILAPLAENIAMRLWHLIIGLPLVLAAAYLTHAHLAWSALLAALPALLLAAGLRFLFTYLLSLSAFWTEQAHGITGLGDTLIFLLGGTAVPIALLPAPLRSLSLASPFPAMLGFPAAVAAGQVSPPELFSGYSWQILWFVIFAALAAAVWRAGVRRYTVVGG